MSYRTELDLRTSCTFEGYVSKKKSLRDHIGTIFVHQNNSDLAAGLAMVGYKVIVASNTDAINQVIKIAKDRIEKGIKAYIVDSLLREQDEYQAPFSLIGYIRLYDPYTPILALSRDTRQDAIASAFRYGATSYLHRPASLDMVVSVIDGLFANAAVIDMANQKISQMVSGGEKRREMIPVSKYLFLDYADRRLCFIDTRGVTTFSKTLNYHVADVLHCLTVNKGRWLSSSVISRLLGEGNTEATANSKYARIKQNVDSVRATINAVDGYHSVEVIASKSKGYMLNEREVTRDVIEEYRVKIEKKEKREQDMARIKSGFYLTDLMEQNNTVKSEDIKLEDLL